MIMLDNLTLVGLAFYSAIIMYLGIFLRSGGYYSEFSGSSLEKCLTRWFKLETLALELPAKENLVL